MGSIREPLGYIYIDSGLLQYHYTTVSHHVHTRAGDYVVEFEKNCFIADFDVLEKVLDRNCGTCSTLRLFNDHGVLLETSHLVEKAKTYRVKRQPENSC